MILYQILHNVIIYANMFNANLLISVKTMPSTQSLESGRVVRKPYVEQNRYPPGLGNGRLPQPSQVRACSCPARENKDQ